MSESLKHTWRQLVPGELFSAVPDHALFFSELLIQQQGVDPTETCLAAHDSLLTECASDLPEK
jgi:hypothetical protein